MSRSFVQKLLRRRCDGRPLAPKPRSGGAAPLLGEQDLERLRRLVRAKPDRTLAELRAALHESGGPAVSVPTVCRALKKLGLPLNKRRRTPASERRRGAAAAEAVGGGGEGRPGEEAGFCGRDSGRTRR